VIVQVKTRDNNGRYVNAIPSEFAIAAFNAIYRTDYTDGWRWLRDWLARWCLIRAQDCSIYNESADRWIRRYQAIRGIE
jgi:hypothetical protein